MCVCVCVINMWDCKIVASEFELKLRYYVHFRANILAKEMNSFITSTGLTITSTVFLQR